MAAISRCVTKCLAVGHLHGEQKESRSIGDTNDASSLHSRGHEGGSKIFLVAGCGIECELADVLHLRGKELGAECKRQNRRPRTRSMASGRSPGNMTGFKQESQYQVFDLRHLAELDGESGRQDAVAGAYWRSGVLEKQSSGNIAAAPWKEGGQKILPVMMKEREELVQVPDRQAHKLIGTCGVSTVDGREKDSRVHLQNEKTGSQDSSLGAVEVTKVTMPPLEQKAKEGGSRYELKPDDDLGLAEPLSKGGSSRSGVKPQRIYKHSPKLQAQRESVHGGSAERGKSFARVREIVEVLRRTKGQAGMANALRRWVRFLTLTDINRVLKELNEVEVASRFFTWVKNFSGHRPDIVTYTSFLKILTRAGKWHEAGQVMEEITSSDANCRPDNFTYSVLIAGASRAGLHKEVTKWFEHMKANKCRPDIVTYNTVISAFVRAGDLHGADAVFQEMNAAGCEPDTFTYSTLASAYGKASLLEKALSLFQAMQDAGHKPDKVAYSIMIDACAKQGAADQAQMLFQKMQSARCHPDAITWNSLILAYTKANRQDDAEESLAAMRAAGFEPDKFTYSSMMWMYAQAGLPEQAEQLLCSLKRAGVVPDDHIKVALMSAHANAGHVERAEELFLGVVQRRIRMSQVAFSSMVAMYGRAELTEKAEGMMKILRAQGLKPNNVMYSTLLDMYGKCGKPMEAVRVLKEMEAEGVKPNLVTYNCLIGTLGNHGMLEAAALCLDRMKSAGLEPDAVTYSTLIVACGKAKRPDDALRHFHDMVANNCRPDVVVYGAIIAVLDRSKRWQEALDILSHMQSSGIEPDRHLRKSMARILTEIGLFKQAEEVRTSHCSKAQPSVANPRRPKKKAKPVQQSTVSCETPDSQSKSAVPLDVIVHDVGHRLMGEATIISGLQEAGDDGFSSVTSVSEEQEPNRGLEKRGGMEASAKEELNLTGRRPKPAEGNRLSMKVVREKAEIEGGMEPRAGKERGRGVGRRGGVKSEVLKQGEVDLERRRPKRSAGKSARGKHVGIGVGVEGGIEPDRSRFLSDVIQHNHAEPEKVDLERQRPKRSAGKSTWVKHVRAGVGAEDGIESDAVVGSESEIFWRDGGGGGEQGRGFCEEDGRGLGGGSRTKSLRDSEDVFSTGRGEDEVGGNGIVGDLPDGGEEREGMSRLKVMESVTGVV